MPSFFDAEIARFTTPYPADGRWAFVSHAPWHALGGAAYGIYLFDMATRRMKLVYDDPKVSDVDPIPVAPRPLPASPPPQRDPARAKTGRIVCASVFHTDLPYTHSAVRYVEVIE